MSELEGYWGPIVGLALGLRKGQAHSFITLKKKSLQREHWWII